MKIRSVLVCHDIECPRFARAMRFNFTKIHIRATTFLGDVTPQPPEIEDLNLDSNLESALGRVPGTNELQVVYSQIVACGR